MSDYQEKWEDFLLDFSVQQMDGLPESLKHFLRYVEIQHIDLVKEKGDSWNWEDEKIKVTFTCRYNKEPLIFFFDYFDDNLLYTSTYHSGKEELYEVIDSTLHPVYQRELTSIIQRFYKKHAESRFKEEVEGIIDEKEETHETFLPTQKVTDPFMDGINEELIATQKQLSPTTLNFLISHSTDAHVFLWTPSETLTLKDTQLNTWQTRSKAPDFGFYSTYKDLYVDYTFQANQPVQLIYYSYGKQGEKSPFYLYWHHNHLWYRIKSSEFIALRDGLSHIGRYILKVR